MEFNGKQYVAEIELFDQHEEEVPEHLGMDELKQFYNDNNQDINKTYDYLINYIKDNYKNGNLANIENTFNYLLRDWNRCADKALKKDKVASNSRAVLEKVLTLPEDSELDNFICITIHELAMDIMHDCDIPALIVAGKEAGAAQHAALIYSLKEGEYIFNNYGAQEIVHADNIKEAFRKISSESSSFEGAGYIALQDGSKMSYQEFLLTDVAALGEKMDKRAYNSEMPQDFKIDDNSLVKGNVHVSNLGNLSASAEVDIARAGNNVEDEIKIGIAYKKVGKSDVFTENSKSASLEIGYKKEIQKDENSSLYYDVDAISSLTSGTTTKIAGDKEGTYYTWDMIKEMLYQEYVKQFTEDGYDESVFPIIRECLDSSHMMECRLGGTGKPTIHDIKCLSEFIRGKIGLKNKILDKDNTVVTNTMQGSLTGGITCVHDDNYGIGGDVRVVAEDGIRMTNTFGKLTLQNDLSAGLVGDLKYTSGKQTGGVMLGGKFNAASGLKYSDNNWTLSAGVDAYYVPTPSAKDWGGSAQVGVACKTKNATVFGAAGTSIEKQNLTLGGFHERCEDSQNIFGQIGVVFNNGLTLKTGVNKTKDAVNKTRNRTTFNIGAVMNF